MLSKSASQISSSRNDKKYIAKGTETHISDNEIATDFATIFDTNDAISIPKFHYFRNGLDGIRKSENTIACFLSGTLIRTPTGNIHIEMLRIGDRITTFDYKSTEIKWIGRRKYSPPIPDNEDIIPILIKAGALGPNVPDRDLSISPNHGIKFDEHIVPAGVLINDTTIYQDKNIANLSYYHIHTAQHEIIIANNTPVETFIDIDNLQTFDNAEEFYFLYPEASMMTEYFLYPRLESGVELERLRKKISLRSGLVENKWTNVKVIGYLDYADRQEVVGWAYSPQKPHEPLKVELIHNDKVLAKAVANIYRADVKRAGFGSGRCGFSFLLPAPLPSMKRHSLSVRVSGQTDNLTGSPVILDPGIASDLLQTGELDRVLQLAARGASSQTEIKKLTDALLATAKNLNAISTRISIPKINKKLQFPDKNNIILFLDSNWPTTDEDAGSNVLVSHIHAFQALGYTIKFCATSGPPSTAGERNGLISLEKIGVVCLSEVGYLPEVIIKDTSKQEIKFVYLHKLVTACNYLGLIRHHMPKAKIIYSIADLHHIRLARQAEIENSPELKLRSKSVRAAELCYIQMVDCVFTHSTAEFDYIRKILPHVNIHVIRWGTTPIPCLWNNSLEKNIGFLGSANHEPNFDAVIHLNDKILPTVWQTAPEVTCFVVGSNWPSNLTSRLDSRIKILGYQPDLKKFFELIKITVAPLRFGAGIKGKVIESMAHRRPCVMSPIAAEGFTLDTTLSKLVGPDDHQVAMILKLLNDQTFNHLVSKACVNMITTQFNQKKITAAIDIAVNIPNENTERGERQLRSKFGS